MIKKPGRKNKNEVDPRGLDSEGRPLSGMALIDRVRELKGDTILLSFSCGKDSLALWLYLREHFNIIPYHLWWIPDMEYVEVSLDYYEKYFQTRIYRMASPIFYDMFTTCAFQPPDRVAVIDGLRMPRFDLPAVDDILAGHLGLDEPFCAVGMRMADNLLRRTLMQQQGVLGFKRRRYFYGIWDWNVGQVSDIIRQHGVKLAPEYGVIGRTIGSFQYQELADMRRAFPADFEKLRQWFPLIDLEFFRYEQVGQAG